MATSPRPLRADAKRNRDQVLAAAVRAFTSGGDVTMDAIAKDAGVGVGTIYRHFPTREALIEAAYRNELAGVCTAARTLLDELDPETALRAWMDRFVDYMATKNDMADALHAVIATGANPYSESRELLDDTVDMLLRAGGAEGTLRTDVLADDVLIALAGIAWAVGESPRHGQAGRLLDLMMDGLRRAT